MHSELRLGGHTGAMIGSMPQKWHSFHSSGYLESSWIVRLLSLVQKSFLYGVICCQRLEYLKWSLQTRYIMIVSLPLFIL
ncbi:hypothetical protein SERLA73DRAFT_188553 [Serpula lacrymans var. lacrymans S7.3]|uniref:Uncharacterized protein n=2 Tax=Serpula lacrymans var. lacrymans TaxID=341189 RepID=F8QBJ3_SERL3|nr:uncharacterized protein SERLADRAFT_478702 [Serpula lacrymans var. lacrymans S7.9]EGN94579.1 hypothetical protein SERLA73DRAFT_188553 [Serpula lacrymans var. lacrymans S7.3]EGO20055.1 hypothetical protein SERLADRAFT_478702 [Serpula lacrymans var. lacrymans S7.9]